MAEEIGNAELLLRRIHPNHVGLDGRVMSLAFRGANLSVDRESLRTLAVVRLAFPHQSLARLLTGACRDSGFTVEADPLPDNTAHALVKSLPTSPGDERRLAQILRNLAEWPAG